MTQDTTDPRQTDYITDTRPKLTMDKREKITGLTQDKTDI